MTVLLNLTLYWKDFGLNKHNLIWMFFYFLVFFLRNLYTRDIYNVTDLKYLFLNLRYRWKSNWISHLFGLSILRARWNTRAGYVKASWIERENLKGRFSFVFLLFSAKQRETYVCSDGFSKWRQFSSRGHFHHVHL